MSQSKHSQQWRGGEVEDLIKALSVVCVSQNAYGSEKEYDMRVDFWVKKLEPRYSVNEVLGAMDMFTDRNNDMPVPADIINILSPEPKKITTAEFIHAKQQWELEGFPSYSFYAIVVKDYEKQEGQEREVKTPQQILEDRSVPAMHPQLKDRLDKALSNDS